MLKGFQIEHGFEYGCRDLREVPRLNLNTLRLNFRFGWHLNFLHPSPSPRSFTALLHRAPSARDLHGCRA
jgi:hypothetical protein